MPNTQLSISGQIGYACGMLGWSILINIINVMLIYFYLPPNNSGLAQLVPEIAVFGILTLLSIIVASGRLVDAITDPLVAFYSDQLQHPKGRRIPFMKYSIVPALIFSVLLFLPAKYEISMDNIWWLASIQIGFYLSLTAYIVPYNALLPELARGADQKVKLSTWLSLAFVIGIIISSQTPGLADLAQQVFNLEERHIALQLAIGSLCLVAGIFMAIPVYIINENKHCQSEPATLPLLNSMGQILSNRNFLVFILADFAYFVSLTIISSGMLYFVRVLLELEESIGGKVMGLMVIVSLLFYPLVIKMAQKYGKRKLMLFALFAQGMLLFFIFFLGKVDIPPRVQIYGFAVLAAVPVAFLGILPFAIIAEIADRDGQESGQQKEAMFFAVRNFSTKLGQTLGIMTFAVLTLFGKDPGNDLGIRLAGLFGAALCLVAGLFFVRFKEQHPSELSTSTANPSSELLE